MRSRVATSTSRSKTGRRFRLPPVPRATRRVRPRLTRRSQRSRLGWPPRHRPHPDRAVTPDETAELLGVAGPFADLSGFAPRVPTQRLAADVAQAYDNKGTLIVETATDTATIRQQPGRERRR